MQFEGLRRSRHQLNLTPLIDIVFLLLVFFMLTAHFVDDESISIELPTADSAVSRDQPTTLEVQMDAAGNIQLNGNTVAATELEEKLRQALLQQKEKWVTLRGDQAAGLGAAVNILDAARRAGADAVDIITQQPQ